MSSDAKTVLWWGRFDPDYSRNRILRQAYAALGWQVADFHPWFSPLADTEARLRRAPRANLIHVPCFRQRDIAAARRYAHRHNMALLIDPLISAYDKQVFERGKLAEGSAKAARLLRGERELFQSADIVLADTTAHARFYTETLGVDPDRLRVVYVGAEESLFAPGTPHVPNSPIEVLFYGSFIPLQGPQVIIEAARLYAGPAVRWVLLGSGPLLADCKRQAQGLTTVTFEDWLPYTKLPERIHRADILLGVFGKTPKTLRVIPNKVFQTLACGKPLVTCNAPAYPAELMDNKNSGITWSPAGDSAALAAHIATLARHPDQFNALGNSARASYEKFFSEYAIRRQLQAVLAALPIMPARG